MKKFLINIILVLNLNILIYYFGRVKGIPNQDLSNLKNESDVNNFSFKSVGYNDDYSKKQINKERIKKFKEKDNIIGDYYSFYDIFHFQLLAKTYNNFICIIHDRNHHNTNTGIEKFGLKSFNEYNEIFNRFDNFQKESFLALNKLRKIKNFIDDIEYRESHNMSIKYCLFEISDDEVELLNKEKDSKVSEKDLFKSVFNNKGFPFLIYSYLGHLYSNNLDDNIGESIYSWIDNISYPKIHHKASSITKNIKLFPYYSVVIEKISHNSLIMEVGKMDRIHRVYGFLKEICNYLDFIEMDFCDEIECADSLNSHWGSIVLFVNGQMFKYKENLSDLEYLENWFISNIIGLNLRLNYNLSHLLYLYHHDRVIFVSKDGILNDDISKAISNVSKHFFGKIKFFTLSTSDEDISLLEFLGIKKQIILDKIENDEILIIYHSKYLSHHPILMPSLNIFMDSNTNIIKNSDFINKFERNVKEFEVNLYKLLTLNLHLMKYFPMTDIFNSENQHLSTKDSKSKISLDANSNSNENKNNNGNNLNSELMKKLFINGKPYYSENFKNHTDYNLIGYSFSEDNSKIIYANEMNKDMIITFIDGDIIILEKCRDLKESNESEDERLIRTEICKYEINDFVKLFDFYMTNKKYFEKFYEGKVFFLVVISEQYALSQNDIYNKLYFIHKDYIDVKNNHKGIKKFDKEQNLKFKHMKKFMINCLEEHLTSKGIFKNDFDYLNDIESKNQWKYDIKDDL